jgi:hypothetical protein
LLFGDGVRQGLFGVDVFLAARRFSGHDLMPMIGHGDHHGIDVVARKQLTIIVIAFAILGPVIVVNHLDRGLQMIRIDIACRHHLAIIRRQKGLRVARPLPAHADHAKIDAVVG